VPHVRASDPGQSRRGRRCEPTVERTAGHVVGDFRL
jgi:hypothetical protein